MKYSFKLRKPKSDSPTPIYFTVYFKDEKKSLIYAIESAIHPSDWDFENNIPKNRNLTFHNSTQISKIRSQCNKIISSFEEIDAIYEKLGEKLFISKAKEELDIKLNRSTYKNNDFFIIYDEFLDSKKNDFSKKGIAESTVRRYKSYKNLLKEFENYRKSKINLSTIDENFYNDLLKFSIKIKKQSANTLHRNAGLLKTFLNWAYKNQKTMNSEFLKFKKPPRQSTNEIALDIDQVTKIFYFNLSSNKKLEKVRDVFLIGCL